MSEENLTNQEEDTEQLYQTEELSKTEAMAGVFSAPGETYETISNTTRKNYWIIPVLICVLAGVISTFLFMQDAELVSKTMDKQKAKMQESFDKNVKEGKMTQEEADKTMEKINPQGTFFKLIGFAGSAIGPFLILFLLSIVYLIILKLMKTEFDFTNILNVVGLAMLIYAVGNLIGVVISILKGNLTGISPGLLFSEGSMSDKIYSLLTKLELFSFWFYIVIGIGLSKIAKIETVKGIIVAFVPFVLYLIITFLFA
jgi:hypothetical protein